MTVSQIVNSAMRSSGTVVRLIHRSRRGFNGSDSDGSTLGAAVSPVGVVVTPVVSQNRSLRCTSEILGLSLPPRLIDFAVGRSADRLNDDDVPRNLVGRQAALKHSPQFVIRKRGSL